MFSLCWPKRILFQQAEKSENGQAWARASECVETVEFLDDVEKRERDRLDRRGSVDFHPRTREQKQGDLPHVPPWWPPLCGKL